MKCQPQRVSRFIYLLRQPKAVVKVSERSMKAMLTEGRTCTGRQTTIVQSDRSQNRFRWRAVTPAQQAVQRVQDLYAVSLHCAASCILALQCIVPLSVTAAPVAPIGPGASPYLEAKRIVYGPTADGRVRSCPTNINPNCVSTGSTNDSYAPAWLAAAPSPAAAADDLERAVLASVEGSDVIQQVTLASGAEYRAFTAPSLFGQDVLEFVIKPDQPSGQLVTYRSMAGSVKYIWPIQQPIGDFGAQRKRLSLIKNNLTGWRALGCELLECYQ